MKKPTKPFQQSLLDAPKRIRLLKRGGRLTPEWYYPDTAVGPHEASFVFVREQAAHIGALIDGWEGLPNDWKADLREGAPAFVRAILALHDDTVSGGQAPDCNELRQVARMALQQFEFIYGKRGRGWDAKFLMGRLRAVLGSDVEEVDALHVARVEGAASLSADTFAAAISALSSRDAEVREVLEALRNVNGCWCAVNIGHSESCIGTQSLYTKLQPEGVE